MPDESQTKTLRCDPQVFAVANSACIHRAVTFGLGRHISSVSDGDLEMFQKVS